MTDNHARLVDRAAPSSQRIDRAAAELLAACQAVAEEMFPQGTHPGQAVSTAITAVFDVSRKRFTSPGLGGVMLLQAVGLGVGSMVGQIPPPGDQAAARVVFDAIGVGAATVRKNFTVAPGETKQ